MFISVPNNLFKTAGQRTAPDHSKAAFHLLFRAGLTQKFFERPIHTESRHSIFLNSIYLMAENKKHYRWLTGSIIICGYILFYIFFHSVSAPASFGGGNIIVEGVFLLLTTVISLFYVIYGFNRRYRNIEMNITFVFGWILGSLPAIYIATLFFSAYIL